MGLGRCGQAATMWARSVGKSTAATLCDGVGTTVGTPGDARLRISCPRWSLRERRAGLRILWGNPCGFNSRLSHLTVAVDVTAKSRYADRRPNWLHDAGRDWIQYPVPLTGARFDSLLRHSSRNAITAMVLKKESTRGNTQLLLFKLDFNRRFGDQGIAAALAGRAEMDAAA